MTGKRKSRKGEETFEDEKPSTSKKARSRTSGGAIYPNETSLSRKTNQQSTSGGKAGRILYMQLHNFMCHSNLRVDFHPRMNFLVGTNGSGKSACLAALQVGLGCSARDTNRSSKIGSLIKSGESKAKVEICLSNEGINAFQPNIYGKCIIVVRIITKTASSFVVKNEQNCVVTRKRSDLERLILFLNVQPDNPVFVLTQDNAKELLKNTDPATNFRYFNKAMQYDTIKENLYNALREVEKQKQTFELNQNLARKKRENLQKLTEELRQAESIKILKQKLETLEIEKQWLLVEEHEATIATNEQKIEPLQRELAEKSNYIERRAEIESEINQQIEEFTQKLTEYNDQYKLIEEDKIDPLKCNIQNINSWFIQWESEKIHHNRKLKDYDDSIRAIKKHLDRSVTAAEILKMRERTENAIKTCKEQINFSNAKRENLNKNIVELKSNITQSMDMIKSYKEQQTMIRRNIDRKSGQINEMKSGAKNTLSVYGQNYIMIINEVEKQYKAGKFNELPRGPLGRYIKVADATNRNVVEQQLSNFLKAFLVNDSQDRDTFMRIWRRLMPAETSLPTIIEQKFQKKLYDVSKGCVSQVQGTRLLLNEIKCADPIVMNCLIDNAKIETILLTDSVSTAQMITSCKENVPKNLLKVVVKSGAEYFPDPFYRIYSLNIPNAKYIQTNVQDHIDQLTQEKEQLAVENQSLEQKIIELTGKMHVDQKKCQEQVEMLNITDKNIRTLEENIAKLEQQELTESPEHSTLTKELQKFKTDRQTLLEKVQAKEAESELKRSEKNDLENHLKTLQLQMSEMLNKHNQLQENKKKAEAKLRDMNKNFKEVVKQEKQLQAQLKKEQSTLANNKKNLEQAIATASTKGERVSRNDGSSSLSAMKETLSEEILALQSTIMHKTRLAINTNINKLRKKIKQLQQQLEENDKNASRLESVLSTLKRDVREQFKAAVNLRSACSMAVQFAFEGFMKVKTYTGNLKFDVANEKLNIEVVPRDAGKDGAVNSIKSLSGGERSYTTVSFLLSLWNAVEHPFFFIDEYDVFTDDVNRAVITQILIMEGTKQINRQYVFLTPQQMNMEHSDIIKIHRFSDHTAKRA